MVSKNKNNRSVSNGKHCGGESDDALLLELLGEPDEVDEEGGPLAEVVRQAQEEAARLQAPSLGKKDNAKNIIVLVNGFRFRRSAKGELLAAFPCATCWCEVWKVADGTLNILQFEIMSGIWDQVGSYCSYCAPLAGESLGKNGGYARQCYANGLTIGRELRQQDQDTQALVTRSADTMRAFLSIAWKGELARYVRLQRASSEEQKEAEAVFLEHFERGLRG